jgi:poly(3-hydroxyalkanoate) synthetase
MSKEYVLIETELTYRIKYLMDVETYEKTTIGTVEETLSKGMNELAQEFLDEKIENISRVSEEDAIQIVKSDNKYMTNEEVIKEYVANLAKHNSLLF